jgi:hypothetical protein
MKPVLALLLSVGAIGAGAFVLHRSSGGLSLSGAQRRRSTFRGPAETRELERFCENDGDLYRQQVQPIEKNLKKKLAKGVFDPAKAEKLWGYLAENCAKKYAREFGDGMPWHKMFSTADRREVARSFNRSFMREEGGIST